MCKDFHACKWPGNLSNEGTSLALFFDAMNENNHLMIEEIQRTCSQIITFSHFVPRSVSNFNMHAHPNLFITSYKLILVSRTFVERI